MSLDIFIEGETLDLCIPDEEFALKSDWFSWFNNPRLNKYLEQGLFPNSREDQLSFYRNEINKRLLLIVNDKVNNIGVISLSTINWQKRSCAIALVLDSSKNKKTPYIALEAMSLVTEHAFTTLGMKRVSAGQHQGLKGWQQRMELIGYVVEGRLRNDFVKGREIADVIKIAITENDFLRIKEYRGNLWDSLEKMKIRLKQLPSKAFIDDFTEFLEKRYNSYYQEIWKL